MSNIGQSDEFEDRGSMAVEQATCEPANSSREPYRQRVVCVEPAADRCEPGNLSESVRLARTEQLLDQHHALIYRYAYRLSGCAATAEDIAQEVFLRAFRSLHQLRDDAAARGWLLVIARNEFARWCRKSAAAGVEFNGLVCESIVEKRFCENAELAVDRNEWVENALAQLPSEYRLVLLMFYFEDLSYAQIAEQLQIPIGTVMSRLSRGRSHMKSVLKAIEF